MSKIIVSHSSENIVLLILILSLFFAGCRKDEEFTRSLPACSYGIIFAVSPFALEDIIRLEPLGHYKPSVHVFPTSHHFVDNKCGAGGIQIYAPCDGWVTYVTDNQLPPPHNVEYSLALWACRDIIVKFVHVARLDESILDKLGKVTSTYNYTNL